MKALPNVTTSPARARSTSTQTVAATQARRVKRAQRLAVDLAIALPLLSDEWLCELVRVAMREVDAREARQG